MSTAPELIDSATVVLVRDHKQQLEVLLLKKSQSINYGGRWVFPGGVLDQNDYQVAEKLLCSDSTEATAKIAAVRETSEESGIEISPDQLHPFAHWTTPKVRSKRYATWFFITNANELSNTVVIDHGEIVEAQWFTPEQALAAQATEDIQLTGPSFVTLSELSKCSNVSQAFEFYRAQELNVYKPRVVATEDAYISLYHADSAYHLTDLTESEILNSTPPLHRLAMQHRGAWKYVKTDL